MNNLILLIRVQLLHLLNINPLFYEKNRIKKLKNWFMILLFILTGGAIAGYAYFYLTLMAPALYSLQMIDQLIGAMVAISSFLIFFTSIYKAIGLIIHCKDYDLLASLPISSTVLILSKWLILYFLNLLFTFLIMVPTVIVYSEYVSISVSFIFFYLISLFFIPLLPMILGTLAGTVIHVIAGRFKQKNLVNILLNFILICFIMYYSVSLNSMDKLIDFGQAITQILNHLYPLTEWYIKAICQSDKLYFTAFIAINALSFILFNHFLAKHYVYLNHLTDNSSAYKNKYSLKNTKEQSVQITLLKKEWQRYLSSPIYVVNTATGIVLQTLATLFIAFKGIDFLKQILVLYNISDGLTGILPLLFCFTIGILPTTASSISFEGKQLWLVKSLPIEPMKLFKAKMSIQFLLYFPLTLINILILAYKLNLSLLTIVIIISMTFLYTVFSAIVGLIINLHFPTFDWDSEVKVVKQSLATFVMLIITMITILIPGYFYIHFATQVMILYSFIIIFILLDILGYYYLKTSGIKIFKNL